MKSIFFDRDDTLIIDKNYMHDPKDLRFFDDTISALQTLSKNGHQFFIVTNQSGVGRGIFSLEKMHRFNEHMLTILADNGIKIQELAYCPHAPEDNCDCRKPKPKLVLDMIDKYKLNKNDCLIVGDKLSDALTGKNAGIESILIKTLHPDFKTVSSLTELAQLLQ
jgi:D-glycero-D-manno-heptose 1,7-bisphosphate phosphatase